MSGPSDNLSPERFAADIEEAKASFDVRQSDEHTILLDIDNDASRAQFDRVYPPFAEHFPVSEREEWKSKSGNTHVRIRMKDALPISTRLALQAALGSDGVRELLAIKLMLNGAVEPSVLFKPKS